VNNSELTAEIARRLPKFSRRDIREILEVLTELWYAELVKPDGEIHLTNLGKLYVETHTMKCRGVLRDIWRAKYGQEAPDMIQRRTVRFRSSDSLREAMSAQEDVHHDQR